MLVKFWIKEGFVGKFKEVVEKCNTTKILKLPHIPEKCPEHLSEIKECLFLCEVEIKETDPTAMFPNSRDIINKLLDQTGFFPIDSVGKHLTSESFSFEKDIKPAFEKGLGEKWKERLAKIIKDLNLCSPSFLNPIDKSTGKSAEILLEELASTCTTLLIIIHTQNTKGNPL